MPEYIQSRMKNNHKSECLFPFLLFLPFSSQVKHQGSYLCECQSFVKSFPQQRSPYLPVVHTTKRSELLSFLSGTTMQPHVTLMKNSLL